MTAAALAAHGLHVAVPDRWEARLYLRERAHPDESPNPVLHLANFALPPGRGDFGTGAVEVMREAHTFVALLEYDREEAGRPLFAAQGMPRLQSRDFAANALQRRLPGQLGCQRFFTAHGRAFCLYVVLGSRRPALVAAVRDALTAVTIHPLSYPLWSPPTSRNRPHGVRSG